MARIYETNGTIRPADPENGKDFSLAELNAIVGGYATISVLPDGNLLICNEDGESLNLPFNANATNIIQGFSMSQQFNRGQVLGDVLVCTPDQIA